MPEPVPDGRWHEYAAIISEGFCPSCRHPFNWSPSFYVGAVYGTCADCDCRWILHGSPEPVIQWTGQVGTASWDVLTPEPESTPVL